MCREGVPCYGKNSTIEQFCQYIPKVELHLHIEGCMTPDLLLKLSQRNHITIPYKTIEEIKEAYNFTDLQSFLDLYYNGMTVLQNEIDYYDLTWDYIQRCYNNDHVIHTEIFFDPQAHIERQIDIGTVINGIHRALQQAQEQYNISSQLIMCYVRHLSVDNALQTLQLSLPYKDMITAVGLDSTEKDHHPSLYTELFDKSREVGYRTVAHAGEEGPAEYVTAALDCLKAERIDHGVHCDDDDTLLVRLRNEQIPLNMCPLSNIQLCVFDNMSQHNIKKLLDYGLCVTINSDDPGYFHEHYITDNFIAVATEPTFHTTKSDIVQFVQNSINASFVTDIERQKMQQVLDEYVKVHL